MTARVSPAESPPFGVVLPFFLAAPFGLMLGGWLLATSTPDIFVAINLPRTVAVSHAVVIGWLTTGIMGATYQLGPAVFGGNLLSRRLARVQFFAQVVAVPLFVCALVTWQTEWMAIAGAGLAVSFALYFANALFAVWRGSTWSLAGAYVATSLGFLVAVAAVGVSFAVALQRGWFPVTLGRLSAHAHLGLAGWLGLTVMGVSYQLVPMFNVVNRRKPRYGWIVLPLTAAGVVLFALTQAMEAPPAARFLAALLLAAGPSLWAFDIVALFRARSRRQLDVQGTATVLAVMFLALTVALGLAAALPGLHPWADQPARLPLAYAIAGIGGWAGCTFIGNTYKILPFLIWFHRYRPLVGREPVPLTRDIYSEPAASAVLSIHASAVIVLVIAALSANLELMQIGGLAVAGGAVLHLLTFAHMFLPKRTSRSQSSAPLSPVSS